MPKSSIETYLKKNSLLLYNIARQRLNSQKNIGLAIRQERLDVLKNYVEKAGKEYEGYIEYNKSECIDEVLALYPKKYDHLRSIRYIVNFEYIANEIITKREYTKALELHYLEQLLLVLILPAEEKIWKTLEKEKKEFTKKIAKKIDEYYIKKITS